MEYKKIKISIFSMISLVFIIILYAIYFISNTGITLYSDDIRMMIITMVMELTIGQLFNLSIVYLGGTLLISILLNARKNGINIKYNHDNSRYCVYSPSFICKSVTWLSRHENK